LFQSTGSPLLSRFPHPFFPLLLSETAYLLRRPSRPFGANAPLSPHPLRAPFIILSAGQALPSQRDLRRTPNPRASAFFKVGLLYPPPPPSAFRAIGCNFANPSIFPKRKTFVPCPPPTSPLFLSSFHIVLVAQMLNRSRSILPQNSELPEPASDPCIPPPPFLPTRMSFAPYAYFSTCLKTSIGEPPLVFPVPTASLTLCPDFPRHLGFSSPHLDNHPV